MAGRTRRPSAPGAGGSPGATWHGAGDPGVNRIPRHPGERQRIPRQNRWTWQVGRQAGSGAPGEAGSGVVHPGAVALQVAGRAAGTPGRQQ